MEMVSAKNAYLSSMIGYTDELEKIKEQIFQVIQLANAEGKFQANYSIQDCPQEIISWLNDYGYTVIIENGFITIDWSSVLIEEAELQTQTQAQEVDPADINDTTYGEEVISGSSIAEEQAEKTGLSEIYINQTDLKNYRVSQISVYGADVQQDTFDGEVVTTYDSFFYLTLVNEETKQVKYVKLSIAKDCRSVLGFGGSLTAMIDNSDKVLMFLNVPVEDSESELENLDIDIINEDSNLTYEDLTSEDLYNGGNEPSLGRAGILNIADERGYTLYIITVTAGQGENASYTIEKVLIDENNTEATAQQTQDAFLLAQAAQKEYTQEDLMAMISVEEAGRTNVLKLAAAKGYTFSDITVSSSDTDIVTAFIDAQDAEKLYTRKNLEEMSIKNIVRLANLKGYIFSGDTKEAMIENFLNSRRDSFAEKTTSEVIAIAATEEYELPQEITEETPVEEAIDAFLDVERESLESVEMTIQDIVLLAEEKGFVFSVNLKNTIINEFLSIENEEADDGFNQIEKVYIYYELNSDGSPYTGSAPYALSAELANTVTLQPSNIIKTHIYDYINENRS